VAAVYSRAAPPKGHTRKLSGKRTGRVEERACIGALSSHSGERQRLAFHAGQLPTEGARGDRIPGPRNLSGTEDRGVTHRIRYGA